MIEPIDLLHGGNERTIASYLVETADGPAIFDCGPATCVDALKAGLAAHGLELRDVRHLLLSHVHLDHAGAAGTLVREHPQLRVHVSAIGAPHLVDPSRLERSARRLYLDAFDRLWGELAPVPEENVHVVGEHVVGEHVVGLDCFPSPGHAAHHVCYLHEDGTLYAGDAAGVRIQPGRDVLPPTPPPDVDVDAWYATMDEIERRRPERLALVHFGVAGDVDRHLADLRDRLGAWTELIAGGPTAEEFAAAVLAGIENADDYDRAMPLWQSYEGLVRWAAKRGDAAA